MSQRTSQRTLEFKRKLLSPLGRIAIAAAALFAVILSGTFTATKVSASSFTDLITSLPAMVADLPSAFHDGRAAQPLGATLIASALDDEPTVSTDKSVYEAGETAVVRGSNWGPGESVTIVLRDASAEAGGIEISAI